MNSFPINTKLINKMNTDCKQVNALAEKNNDRKCAFTDILQILQIYDY